MNSTLPLPLEIPDERLFRLDGRTVGFPEGLKTADFTHTIHRFPGKFVPQVARELLGLVGVAPDAGLVSDPFCGSGTTLVEAATMGIQSIGVDFDPLGALISRVKTTPLSQGELGELAAHWRIRIPENAPPDHVPQVKNLSHWFTPSAISQLSFIKGHCLTLPERVREFSLVILSSIVRRVSNADDQTQKTYVSGTLPKTPPEPRNLFPVFMARAISGMGAFTRACRIQPIVIRADARSTLGQPLVQGIATSPPYLDSIDYVYNQMLEYFWLHEQLGLASQDDIRALRSKPVGFSRGDLDALIDEIATFSGKLANLLKPDLLSIRAESRKEAEHVAGYFRDYAMHLQVCRTAMAPGARYALSIGESVVRGCQIGTPSLLAILFESQGFKLVGRCAYDIKRHYMKFPRRSNSGTIKLDHVLCFEAQ